MILNKSAIILFLFLIPCIAQNELEDPREAMIRHKQAYYSRAAELLKSSEIQETKSQSQIDARYYQLNMTINYNPNHIEASVTGIFTSLTSNLTTIELNLENSLSVDSVGDAAISFSHNNNLLTLTLDRAYNVDEDVIITVYYSGLPNQNDRRSFQYSFMPSGSPMA